MQVLILLGSLYFAQCTSAGLVPQSICSEKVTNHYIGNLEMAITPNDPILIKEGENITVHGAMQILREIPKNTTIGLNFTYTLEEGNITVPIPSLEFVSIAT